MQNWFEILGIGENADMKTIRRAYARKLKTIDQENDRQAFMQLREAYDYGRYIALQQPSEHKSGQVTDEQIISTDIDDDLTDKQENIVNISDARQEGFDSLNDFSDYNNYAGQRDFAAELMDEIKALARSPWKLDDIGSWQALLDDERLDDLQTYSDFENYFLNWLLDENGYFEEASQNNADMAANKDNARQFLLKPEITRLIFERFGWDEKRNNIFIYSEPYDFLAQKLLSQPAKQSANTANNINEPGPDKEFPILAENKVFIAFFVILAFFAGVLAFINFWKEFS